MNHVKPEFINWLITILLAVIAIMATILTANHISMGLIGLAALFTVFGWYGVSWGILSLAAMIALLMILKQGDKNMK